MSHPYGAWATLITAGRHPQLSAFWRRRLTRLPAVARANTALTRSAALALIATALVICVLPTLQGRAVSAEPAGPAAAANGRAGLTYAGMVVEKGTGKPIAGATVTVRHSLLTPNEIHVLEEPQYRTDAEGRYSFTIPPQEAADRYLYIELDVSHPDYAPRRGFGYALSMIRKNEKIGGRPFFERIEMIPGEPIAGTVVMPDGKPAAGVKVLAFSTADRRDFETMSFAPTQTDEKGKFRVNLAKGGDGMFWILPKDYAPSTHVVLKKRGDLGRFVLQPGIRTEGRVTDEQGKPVGGVWVNACIFSGTAKQQYELPVADMLARTGLTDAKGAFALGPLPAGEYVLNVEKYPHDSLVEDRTFRPVPGVFGPRPLTLKPGEASVSVEVRGLPTVVVEGQFYDSGGKPRSGHAPMLWGQMPGRDLSGPLGFFHTEGKMEDGTFVIRAPKGLEKAMLTLHTNEHSALRVRIKKDGPLMNQTQYIDLGTLRGDVRGIEVVRYEAPILLVKPVADDGKILKDAKLRFEYAKRRSGRADGGRLVDGYDVSYERQEDGRLRSEQLLPDEEFTLTVSATGYQSKSETLKLPEGAVKELTVQLQKAGQ
jgi:uncharacterized GH25 family protein